MSEGSIEKSESIIDSRFDPKVLKEAFKKLEQQGYQKWPEELSLTRTQYIPEVGKFETVETGRPEEALKEVLEKAQNMSGMEWEAQVIIEQFEQEQKRAHVFLKKK